MKQCTRILDVPSLAVLVPYLTNRVSLLLPIEACVSMGFKLPYRMLGFEFLVRRIKMTDSTCTVHVRSTRAKKYLTPIPNQTDRSCVCVSPPFSLLFAWTNSHHWIFHPLFEPSVIRPLVQERETGDPNLNFTSYNFFTVFIFAAPSVIAPFPLSTSSPIVCGRQLKPRELFRRYKYRALTTMPGMMLYNNTCTRASKSKTRNYPVFTIQYRIPLFSNLFLLIFRGRIRTVVPRITYITVNCIASPIVLVLALFLYKTRIA